MLPIEAHRTVIRLFCSRRIKKSRCLIEKSYKKDRNLTKWTCFFKILVLANVRSFSLAINLHYKCVKTSQLTREDIESNPGPRNYAIKKALLASHHQGHSCYGDSAGMQCTSIAYFSIIYSAVKRVGLWKSLDLDIIFAQGDELFKSVRFNKPLAVDELPLTFSFAGHDISCQRLSHESHLFFDIDNLFENYR